VDGTLAVDLTSVFCAAANLPRHRQTPLTDPSAVLIGSTAGLFGEAGTPTTPAQARPDLRLARTLKNEVCRLAPRGR